MPINNEMTLNSGRKIAMQELRQELTYAGIIDGLPTKEGNARQLAYLIETCRASSGNTPVVFFHPEEKPIEWNTPYPYPFGTPSALPAVICIAKFKSTSLNAGDFLSYSELVIVWLQEEFAMPIEDETQTRIAELDWENVAADLEI